MKEICIHRLHQRANTCSFYIPSLSILYYKAKIVVFNNYSFPVYCQKKKKSKNISHLIKTNKVVIFKTDHFQIFLVILTSCENHKNLQGSNFDFSSIKNHNFF